MYLKRWFRQLNDYFKVRGRCHFLYKPKGMNSTSSVDEVTALSRLKEALKVLNILNNVII